MFLTGNVQYRYVIQLFEGGRKDFSKSKYGLHTK
jgi:hypothetical protein